MISMKKFYDFILKTCWIEKINWCQTFEYARKQSKNDWGGILKVNSEWFWFYGKDLSILIDKNAVENKGEYYELTKEIGNELKED